MARLAVVLDDPRADHLEAFVTRNQAVCSVLVIATRGADDDLKRSAARLERNRDHVIYMDLEAGHEDTRRLLINSARMFPADAVAVLRQDETFVVDDPQLLDLSLLEAGSHDVRVRATPHGQGGASQPEWLAGRLFPAGRSQLDLLSGWPIVDGRAPGDPFHLVGARIVRSAPLATRRATPNDGMDAARRRNKAFGSTKVEKQGVPLVQETGSQRAADSPTTELVPGVFEPGFHVEQLYLDLPPFEYARNVLRPQSVLDIGCGLGGYLALFREQGVERTLGVDGFPEPEAYLDPGRYRCHDLRKRLDLGERFGLVVCTEVIEHVAPESEGEVLDTIERHAEGYILFSGARPGQPGVAHVNLRSTEYWIRAWQLRGWQPAVFETLAMRSLATFHWFRRNLLLLARSAGSRSDFDLADLASFEASMVDWVGQDAELVRHPLTAPLPPARSSPE